MFTAPEKVSDAPNGTRLDSGSAASYDGAFVRLDDEAIGSPLIWRFGTGENKRLRG